MTHVDTQPLPDPIATQRLTGISQLNTLSTTKKRTTKLSLESKKKSKSQPSSSAKRVRLRLNEVAAYEQEREARRVQGRVVRVVVPGNQQTRVICYPDKRDYLRLVGGGNSK